jgi:outer membrane lipoprotein LolB
VTRQAWPALLALVLAGCAATPRVPEGGAAPDPGVFRQWTASGRMAIATGNDGGSGAFDWAQDDATTRLDLRGPLGAGSVRLVVTPESVSLADGTGRVLDAEAAKAGLQARLGADLPWGHLRYWMLGLAAPGDGAAVQEFGAAPWRVIEQSGWRLTYESFAEVQGVSLPTRFAAQQGAVRVRVIVDRWSPGRTVPAAPESPR